MLRAIFFRKSRKDFCRTYFSSEFKRVLNEGLGAAADTLPSAYSKQAVNDVNLFMNRITADEVNRRNVCEQFTKLRSTAEGTNAFNLANHLIIKRFIEAGRQNDLTDILKNRLYYRIFADVYTGCYLLDHLLKVQEYTAAAEISLQLILQEYFEHDLLTLLSIKSLCCYIQTSLSNNVPTKSAEEPETPEKKTRVKYLRNSPINVTAVNSVTNSSIGKAILMNADKCHHDIQLSLKLLGLLLCGKYEDCSKTIVLNSTELHTDILALCATLIKDKNEASLLADIEKVQANSKKLESFDTELHRIIMETCKRSERNLIENQSNKYIKWAEESKNDVLKELQIQQKALWNENIEKDLAEVYTNNKKLNFFNLEDQIDLEIFQKKRIYPKKWFGKKKKPKVIDDDYIPPEIVKRAT